MPELDLSGCRKRKRGERVFKFKVFGENGYPAEFNGSFQENVRALLEYGRGVCGPMPSWSFQLEVRRHPLLHLFLLVVEEPIELSLNLRCNHCHYIGWGHQMMCNKKYHFVLPGNGDFCKSNVIEMQAERQTLHAVFHSNGFGHLLCINASSQISLPGYQIMDFWDRLCSGLGARKVSLRDVAKREGMDLRLLHTVAYGKPWFGHWDYVFGRGTFGINQETYLSGIKAIQNLPLGLITTNRLAYPKELQIILPRYQILSANSLVTLGDLFHFMLELKFRIPKESNEANSHYPRIMSDTSCRWSPKRVEMAIHVVVEALKQAEFQWVSRQHVRDVARTYIGDTGLLDFVLKSLGNHMVGRYFVRRCLNPVTKVLEYCLEDVTLANSNCRPNEGEVKTTHQQKVSWGQLKRDIFSVYKNMFLSASRDENADYSGVLANNIHLASTIILDSKYLVKEYCGDLEMYDETNKWRVHCAVTIVGDEKCVEEGTINTPYHCVMLRCNARFEELRCEVEKIFREMYLGLREFVADSMQDHDPMLIRRGSDLVFKMIKPGSKIVFEWKKQVMDGGGATSMVVDCLCGAKEDDGERLVGCDVCQVWQHTRCLQIPEADEVPNIFICSTCERDIILPFPSFP